MPQEYAAQTLETADKHVERTEQKTAHQIETASQPPVTTGSTTLPPLPSQTSASTSSAASDDLPLVAADDDLIEKEWVDKIKRVMAETKDDPYRREQEVKKLQVDYVRKRYGREIGKNDNQQI